MAPPVPPLPPARIPGPPAVLVVDLDRPWSEAVCAALRGRGLAPVAPASPEEARWRLHERKFDLVVLSSSIADGAIESLLADLRGQGTPPPILLIDDHRGGKSSEAWRFIGAAHVLRRPCRVRDVADAAWVITGGNGAERTAMA